MQIPVTERMVNKWDIYHTIFNFGPFTIQLYLKDGKYIPAHVYDKVSELEKKNNFKAFDKRYACFLYVDYHLWIWFSSDNKKEAEEEYRRAVTFLKNEKEYTFPSLKEKKEPLTLSWCMFKWGH